MEVTNIDGTRQNICKCGSWLNHWRKFNSSGAGIPAYCPAFGCVKKDLVGAHVQKAGPSDRSWYICPLCEDHNKATGSLEVNCALAPADVSKTCGK